MGIFRKLALLGAFALLIPNAAAMAADMPEAPVVPGPTAGTPVEFGSGWYLRGDVGYKVWHTPSLTFFNSITSTTVPYDNETLANTWVAGFGFGYQFNQRFRADITADYEGAAAFGATVFCGGPCGSTIEAAHVSAWTFLANAYLDFPLMGEGPGNITPYVGAGIGVADVNWANYTSTCPGGGGCGPPPVADYGSTSQWRFAWALTAGASFHLTNKLLLDANYRFLDIANGLAVAQVGTPSFGHSTYKDLYAHEFRIGLRYLIN